MPGKLILSLIISVCIGICSIAFAQEEFIWTVANAHFLLPKLQSSPLERAIIAAGIQLFAISAIASGLVFGYLKQTYKGPQWWRIVPIVPVILLAMICKLDLFFVLGIFATCFYCSMFLGEFVFIELSKRTLPWRILLPGFAAIVIAMGLYAFTIFDLIPPSTAFPLSAFLIFLAGIAACYGSRSSDLGQAFVVTGLCSLPFALFELGNFAYCCFFLLNNGLSASAVGMLSTIALGITVNLIGAVLGAFLGSILTRKRFAN